MDMRLINETAEKYLNAFLDMTSTYEEIDKMGLLDDFFKCGCNADPRKFIASTPDLDAYNKVEDLEKVVDSIADSGVLISVLMAKFSEINEITLDNRMWFLTILKRIQFMTIDDVRELLMTIQELQALLKEKKDDILAAAPDLEEGELIWLTKNPLKLLELDSGIAYDLAKGAGITVEDILGAIEREEMLGML